MQAQSMDTPMMNSNTLAANFVELASGGSIQQPEQEDDVVSDVVDSDLDAEHEEDDDFVYPQIRAYPSETIPEYASVSSSSTSEVNDEQDDLVLDDIVEHAGKKRRRTNKGAASKSVPPNRRGVARYAQFEMFWGSDVQKISLGVRMMNMHIPEISAPGHKALFYSAFFNHEHEQSLPQVALQPERQHMALLASSSTQIISHLPSNASDHVKILLGPVHADSPNQKSYSINSFASQDLSIDGLFPHKNGFLLNAGGAITALDWASRRPEGNQYLILATKSGDDAGSNNTAHSAFSGFAHPSSLQLWRFQIEGTSAGLGSPTLETVFCTNWGNAIRLMWAPGITEPDVDKQLGFLLGVFEDGIARVISIERSDTQETRFVAIDRAMFELQVGDSIITCATWTRNHIIVAGCANGMVAMWDLSHVNEDNERYPISYKSLHTTYINDIVSLSPSYQYHIAAVSLDGRVSVHDIRDPEMTTTYSPRTRANIFNPYIAWIDRCQSIAWADEPLCLKLWSMRRLDSGIIVAESSGECMSVSLGGGGYHNFLLFGTRDGRARLTNLCRKFAHVKTLPIHQTWFKLEYAPKTDQYRMLEGFLAEGYNLKQGLPATIQHPKTDITCVGWNPNRQYGSWAAIAMANGLLRIEDICRDKEEAVPNEGDAPWLQEEGELDDFHEKDDEDAEDQDEDAESPEDDGSGGE